MHRFTWLAVVFLLIGASGAKSAQLGSPDAAFTTVPFDRWVEEGDQAHIRWTARVLPVELSNHQRLEARVELQVDGNELVRRRGKGYLMMFVQFTDNQNRVYQTHDQLDLQLVKEDTGKANIFYMQTAFVTPGDYRIALAIFDTATGEHSAMRLPLHVGPLKNDSLPDSWQDLPPIEILEPVDSPDDLFLPNVAGRLHLPLETHRSVRIDVLVNASPLATGELSRTPQTTDRSLASLIPALKVIAQADVRNGTLNVALLDLTTRQVIFQQDAVHDLDWPKLAGTLKQADPGSIDVHALEDRRQNAQFFVAQVGRRIEGGAPDSAKPIVIVLSSPMSFGSGEDMHPIELGSKSDSEVFYIRYHSLPVRAAMNLLPEEQGRRRRTPMLQQPRNIPPADTEPVDSLERTLKPLQPHVFDVYTPEQFRKALSTLLNEISRL